jgi:DAK2 domain fusion protein YloV
MNAAAMIEAHRNEINELNVFPVPDGDTGTNMSLTMGAGAKALESASPGTVGRAADVAAGALLRGARGNSGVILSLLVRGMARRLRDIDSADAATFASALAEGVDAAYKAVMKPAEGTILTVSRVASERAVAEAESGGGAEEVIACALEAGLVALRETVNQNPTLKKANVVDAGAKGYLYILEGMGAALRGETLTYGGAAEQGEQRADFSEFATEDIRFAYCTEFIAEKKTGRDVNQLRDFLDVRGDSIVVVEDDEIIKAHVHTNEPGAVITQALAYGPLISVKIENMRIQHTEKLSGSPGNSPARPPSDMKKYGAVAVCAGEGMSVVFSNLGVDNIVAGGQTMNPSTADILSQIDSTPSEVVFVLPNNKNIIMAANQCASMTDKAVVVIPTQTVPQGIAAMLAFDASAGEGDNTIAMTKAAEGTHTAFITRASRGSTYGGSEIGEGEYLALLEQALIANSSDFSTVAGAVAGAIKALDPEFITIYAGDGAQNAQTDELTARMAAEATGAEIVNIFGGQPVYNYVISAE